VIPPQFVPKGTSYRDEDDKLRLETRNGVIQAEFIFYTASNWRSGEKITPELLLELQRLAVNQIYRCAGHFRDGPVTLEGADHKPPPWEEVRFLVSNMVAYLNEHWNEGPATSLSAYAMWRLNWIHPFFGGNGRTARAFSYLVLCLRLGFTPPTEEKNIPELIVEDRKPYYAALRRADEAWLSGEVDISMMESLISSLLARQLASIHFRATGRPMPDI
jgi:Fic family protein